MHGNRHLGIGKRELRIYRNLVVGFSQTRSRELVVRSGRILYFTLYSLAQVRSVVDVCQLWATACGLGIARAAGIIMSDDRSGR